MEEYTLERLKEFNGQDNRPIYVCVLGRVYDMSSKPQFYGPGGSYGLFAGHDASRALAKMSLTPEDLDKPIADLTEAEQQTLAQWKDKYNSLYPVVGSCSVITKEEV